MFLVQTNFCIFPKQIKRIFLSFRELRNWAYNTEFDRILNKAWLLLMSFLISQKTFFMRSWATNCAQFSHKFHNLLLIYSVIFHLYFEHYQNNVEFTSHFLDIIGIFGSTFIVHQSPLAKYDNWMHLTKDITLAAYNLWQSLAATKNNIIFEPFFFNCKIKPMLAKSHFHTGDWLLALKQLSRQLSMIRGSTGKDVLQFIDLNPAAKVWKLSVSVEKS